MTDDCIRQREVILRASTTGWMGGVTAKPIEAQGKAEVAIPRPQTPPCPWSFYAHYGSPEHADLAAGNDPRAPAYLELRWSSKGARDTIVQAPIPAAGLALSAPAPAEVRIGHYRPITADLSVIVQGVEGRPVRHWATAVNNSQGATGMQLVPPFASRIFMGGGSNVITWYDYAAATLASLNGQLTGGIPHLARYFSAASVVAFEVTH